MGKDSHDGPGTPGYAMLFPGRRPDAQQAASCRVVAKRGCSVCQGPTAPLGCGWFTSFHGLEYMQLYLWLLKDWSWSQLHWFNLSMGAGTLALVLILMLVLFAVCKKLYAEAYIGFGLFLWLLANYWWMIGELWNDNIIEDEAQGDAFYDSHYFVAKYVCLASTTWVTSYFVFIRPCNIFKNDRLHPLMMEMNTDVPPQPFPSFFRDFREYEHLHLLFWAYKDVFWAWNFKELYVMFFVLALLLNIDLLVRFAMYRNQFVDWMHYLALLFWLLANGVWAVGELYVENPNDDKIDRAAIRNYSWFSNDVDPLLQYRHDSGWLFLASALVLVAMYIIWALCTLFGPTRVDNMENLSEYSQNLNCSSGPSGSGQSSKNLREVELEYI